MRLTGSIGSGTDLGRTTISAPASCRVVLRAGSVGTGGGVCARELVTKPHPSAVVRAMRPNEMVHLLILLVVPALKLRASFVRARLLGRLGAFDRAPPRRCLPRRVAHYHSALRHPRPRWQPPALCVRLSRRTGASVRLRAPIQGLSRVLFRIACECSLILVSWLCPVMKTVNPG